MIDTHLIICESVQGRCYWVGRMGICPLSFSWIRGKESLKIAKFVQLVCTYCRCYQNLWSCPPSFYKIAPPLLSVWYVKRRQLKLNQLCVWIWKGCHNFTYFANDAGKRCILFRYHSKITLILYHKNQRQRIFRSSVFKRLKGIFCQFAILFLKRIFVLPESFQKSYQKKREVNDLYSSHPKYYHASWKKSNTDF